MKRVLTGLLKVAVLAALLMLVVFFAWAFESRGMPALQIWHTALLGSEFTAHRAAPNSTMQDYLSREQQLFDELRDEIYKRVEPTDDVIYSRYRAGGVQDPAWPQGNWNRTFELVPSQIRGGALLLHGLTDSPYSLRRIGQILYDKGFYVLGLRLPGHGTIPAALTQVRWEDWVAASRIGARHVRERIGAAPPFVMAGYSNGGGLTIKYALDALTDPQLPVPDQMLLFSPEIGILPVAGIANAHKLLSFLPYFAQFKWLSIEPEYDPFKYNSFPKNAAQEAWEVTQALHRQLKESHDTGRLKNFPRVLTFLSWSDSTVETSATIRKLYDQLQNPGSELVVFDVNRSDRLAPLIHPSNASLLEKLQGSTQLPYRLTVIGNAAGNTAQLAQKTKAPGSGKIESSLLHMAWPKGVFSLAHVAIPFAPDDPVYGASDDQKGDYHGLPLGALKPRGETHLLTAPLSQLMRLRHNPFFEYLKQRVAGAADSALRLNSR